MTIRNILLLLFFCTAISTATWAQGWVTTTGPGGGFSFQTPALPQQFDTVNTLLYIYSVDSNLVLQVYQLGGIALNDTVNSSNISDLFTGFGLTLTSGTLVCNQNVTVSPGGYNSREIGIQYTGQDGNPVMVFSETVYYNNQILNISITAPQSRLTDLLAYKSVFFASLAVN